MRIDLKDVVESVKKIVNLNEKVVVVEICYNDCTLLNLDQDNLKLVGFEPVQNIKYIDKKKNIKIFSTYFNSKDFKDNYK